MKSLEELQLTTSDVTAVLPKIIASEIETSARPRRYGRQLLASNRDLVGRPGRSIHLPVRGGIVAGRVAEGATSTILKSAYSTVEVTPFKISVHFIVTQETINAMEMDVIQDFFDEAGHALADLEDLEILREVHSGETIQTMSENGDSAATTFDLGKTYVTEIVSVTVGGSDESDYTVDFIAGHIEFGSAPATGTDNVVVTYYYWDTTNRNTTQVFEASTVTQFGLIDMVTGRTKVRNQKFNPGVMVIPVTAEAEVLTDAQFVDASQYGGREGILNGEVGKIAGMRVVSTTQLYEGTVVYIDINRAGKFVAKRDPEVKRKDLPETDSFGIWVYQEFAPEIVNATALAISLGHGTKAVTAVSTS